MKYIVCDNCQHKNPALSERLVFCSECHKKLATNFMDWQKTKFNTSFEAYIKDLKTDDSIETVDKKTNTLFTRKSILFKPNLSKNAKIFISTSLLQLVLFGFLLYQQKASSLFSAKNFDKKYLKEIQWEQHSITNDLSIVLPFELKKSSSILPYYLKNYLSSHTKKSESSRSFSVTIEEMIVNSCYSNSVYVDLVDVKDDYMQEYGTIFTSQNSTEHFKINDYQIDLKQGSYTLNGNDYLYENYTLIKGNKAFKIVMSYLQHDDLLSHYAAIVSNSLLRNTKII